LSSEDANGPPPLEKIPFDPEAYTFDSGAVGAWRQAERVEIAKLVDIGAIEPPRPNQRIILDPRFFQIEINCVVQQQLQYQRQVPSRPIYTTCLGTVVRTFGNDDITVGGTVEPGDSMISADNLPSIDIHLPSDMKSTMGEYNSVDLIVYKEQLGNTLARCQHSTRDCGHSPLVDTLV
jgi:hypothetical protein